MAELQITKIKSLYGEARGILLGVENSREYVSEEMAEQYNELISEIEAATNSSYSRLRSQEDSTYTRDGFLPKITSLVVKLENEFGFNLPMTNSGQTIVVTVDQAQHQIQTTQVNIDLLITESADLEVKEILSDLKNEINKHERDVSKLKELVGKILNKGWDLFLVVLPYIIEQMGKR